VFFKIIWNLRS